MMSDPNTVDRTTVDEATGKLVLLIEEPRQWREPDLMHRQLAAKVKHYVRYVRSKEFAQEHGRPPQDTVVRLACADAPSAASLKFFERVRYELSKHGMVFEHRVGLPEATPTPPAAPATEPPPSPAADLRPAPPPSAEPSFDEAAAPVEPPEPTVSAGESKLGGFISLDEAMAMEESQAAGSSAETESFEFIGYEESSEPSPSPHVDASAAGKASDKPPPPFFPEEEFGRALPDAGGGSSIIETPSGQRVRVSGAEDVEGLEDFERYEGSAAAVPGVTELKPSLLAAVGAIITAALASAIVWGLLSIPAGNGAAPLALVVALMVGISVRVRGAGSTMPFRILGMIGTLIGCFLGGILAAAVQTAAGQGLGLSGILTPLSSVESALAAFLQIYKLTDLAWIPLALYLAFKLSATKIQ